MSRADRRALAGHLRDLRRYVYCALEHAADGDADGSGAAAARALSAVEALARWAFDVPPIEVRQ